MRVLLLSLLLAGCAAPGTYTPLTPAQEAENSRQMAEALRTLTTRTQVQNNTRICTVSDFGVVKQVACN